MRDQSSFCLLTHVPISIASTSVDRRVGRPFQKSSVQIRTEVDIGLWTHRARNGNLWGSSKVTKAHKYSSTSAAFLLPFFIFLPPVSFAAFSSHPCHSFHITLTVLLTHCRFSLTHLNSAHRQDAGALHSQCLLCSCCRGTLQCGRDIHL